MKSTMSYFSWNLVGNGFISAYVVNIGNVFTSKQPTVFRCTCLVNEDLGMILEKFYGAEFSWVVLRVFRFRELVFDKILMVDLGRPGPLLDL